jgi:hypothetical protein
VKVNGVLVIEELGIERCLLLGNTWGKRDLNVGFFQGG